MQMKTVCGEGGCILWEKADRIQTCIIFFKRIRWIIRCLNNESGNCGNCFVRCIHRIQGNRCKR